MKIGGIYSHLNAEEYLIVHHKKEYNEIKKVIKNLDASKFKTKVSKEKGRVGDLLYNPKEINLEFIKELGKLDWKERRRDFYVSTEYDVVQKIEPMDREKQKEYLNYQSNSGNRNI